MLFGFFEPDVPGVSAEDVWNAIQKHENVKILDVRTPEEYSRNRIKGSIHLPIDQVGNKITSIIPDKKQKIYVYCLSGARSTVAVDTMIKLGYTNVYSVKSGLLAWRVKKLPLES